MPSITLHSAGAGTGKTFKICQEIADRVAKGLDPRRILAATFTRKAAAELKSRVQGHLLSKGLVQKAEELELSAMGTVHSVGHQLVSRFALRLGLSPDLEILTEDAEADWLKHSLTGLDPEPMRRLSELCRRFEQPVEIVFELLRRKRQNNISDQDFRGQLLESARRLCGALDLGHAGKGGLPEASREAQALAKEALKQLDADEPVDDSLLRVARYGAENWRDLSKLGALKSKDEAVSECLAPVQAFAERLLRHPGLAADITAFADCVAENALSLEAQYRRYKTERGLLDYTDLEELFYKLITDPALRPELAEEIRLVVIDEFQDTNPIQLAIFMALSGLAEESIWVGDQKQSIYLFNGADPELMQAVWDLPQVKRGTLPMNRRSGKGLVDLFNAVFTPVFGAGSKLEAYREAAPAAVERWLLQAKNKEEDAAALANGVAGLIKAGAKKSDIAVLVRTGDFAQSVGARLNALGIPVSLTLPGLLSTRECAVLVAALRVVADRGDSLACATVLHLLEDNAEETPGWIVPRLEELRKGEGGPPFAGQPVIEGLAGLDYRNLSPSAAVTAAVEALGLCARIANWPEPARRHTHLDSLLALAKTYEDETAKAGGAVTLTGFIGYLEELASDGADERSSPLGLDAVNVMTFHKSKGLEWPVVVLAQLDKTYSGDPCSPWVDGGEPKRGKPLAGRELHYWPCPFGEHPPKAFTEAMEQTDEFKELSDKQRDESVRILYVGFTRAKDRLVLATRVTQTKKDGEKHKHSWLDTLPSFGAVAGAVEPGTHKLKGIATGLVVRKLANEPEALDIDEADMWLKAPGPAKKEFAARWRSPSQEPAVKAELRAEKLPGDQPDFGRGASGDFDLLGDAVHAYLGALPSLMGSSEAVKAACAKRALAAFGMEGAILPAALVAAGERFRVWVEKNYPGARWHVEAGVTAPSRDGRQWHGVMDLLLELPDGRCVVVDHKSAPLGEKAWVAKAQEFSGQVLGYAEALKGCGVKGVECWIHFPIGGGVVRVV